MTCAGTGQYWQQTWPAPLAAMLLLIMRTGNAADLQPAAQRGAAVFEKYCVLCHGSEGHGDGRAAPLQRKQPSDLTSSVRTDLYKLQIIRSGGSAMQRSSSMPAWSEVLTDAQIRDVVAYLRTLLRSSAPTPTNAGTNPGGARE